MASAAAVAANEARSPLGNDIGEDEGRPGEITSGIYSKDEGLPGANGDLDESDNEDELPSNPLRGMKSRRPVNGDADGDGDKGVEDLFGDEEDGEAGETQKPAFVSGTSLSTAGYG